MKKMLIILLICIISAPAFAATSANYVISTEIIDAGAASATSASFRLEGKSREIELSLNSSAGFILGPGFLRSAYFTRQAVLAPIVTAITPSTAPNTGTVNITNLAGANFQPGASVKLSRSGQPDINATNEVTVSPAKITCTFDLTGAASGLWNVTVTNPDGRSGTLPAAFSVNISAPTVISIIPDKGNNNAVISITDLKGKNFQSGASVKLTKTGQADITADNVVVASENKITCKFDLRRKTVGQWNVSVTNTGAQTGTLTQGFKIEAPSISIIGPVTNTPNPFNPRTGTTSIKYTLSKDADIILYIYNIRGERVWQKIISAGSSGGRVGLNEVVWNGLTDFNSVAGFGVYILMVTTPSGGSVQQLGKTKIAIIE